MKIQVTKDEWEDIIEGPSVNIHEEPGKRSSRYVSIVFKRDDKLFQMTYSIDYEWGVDDYQFPLTAYEVKAVEKVIIDYVKVE